MVFIIPTDQARTVVYPLSEAEYQLCFVDNDTDDQAEELRKSVQGNVTEEQQTQEFKCRKSASDHRAIATHCH